MAGREQGLSTAAFLGEKPIFHLMLWCEEGREMGYKELGQRRERRNQACQLGNKQKDNRAEKVRKGSDG